MRSQASQLVEERRAGSTPKDLAKPPRFGSAAANPLGFSVANIQAIA
jgi:hypothetical protein